MNQLENDEQKGKMIDLVENKGERHCGKLVVYSMIFSGEETFADDWETFFTD